MGMMTCQTVVPQLITGDGELDKAFRIAIGDLFSCLVVSPKHGCMEKDDYVLTAGLDYGVWVRDAAINEWNGSGLLFPMSSRNSLLFSLTEHEGRLMIGMNSGQGWDTHIWTIGAWRHYLVTGDKTFLKIAFEASLNTLEFKEQTEFDPQRNLFRGGAVFMDGISGYPDVYSHCGGFAALADWPRHNPQLVAKSGFGAPMHALSTNCVYVEAYRLLALMAAELGRPIDPRWGVMSRAVKDAINAQFWRADAGLYRYLVDPLGNCDHQEGIGNSLAILLGIADERQCDSVFRNQYVTPSGIAALWPTFERYTRYDGQVFPIQHGPDYRPDAPTEREYASGGKHYGAHSGTVWPMVQGFWADAAAACGKIELFEAEMRHLAAKACRDSQFAERYHPLTGEIYGGLQEGWWAYPVHEMLEWRSCSRQSWSATAYLRSILHGLIGMRFGLDGITFCPKLPSSLQGLSLGPLRYRDMMLSIRIAGSGQRVGRFTVSGQERALHVLPTDSAGWQQIVIEMLP